MKLTRPGRGSVDSRFRFGHLGLRFALPVLLAGCDSNCTPIWESPCYVNGGFEDHDGKCVSPEEWDCTQSGGTWAEGSCTSPPTADAGSDASTEPKDGGGDASTNDPEDAGDDASTADGGPLPPSCPLPQGLWTNAAEQRGIVRSLAVHGAVFAATDGIPARIEKLGLLDGEALEETGITVPGLSQTFPRLQLVRAEGGEIEVFVSYLGSLADRIGGVARLARVQPWPAATSLIPDLSNAVDGIFATATGPVALSYTQDGTSAELHQLGADDSWLPLGSLPIAANHLTRTLGVYQTEGTVFAFVRKDDQASTWKSISLTSDPPSPVDMPEAIVDVATHDSRPLVYALTTSRELKEITLGTNQQRTVGQLPAGVTAANNSFARMTYAYDSVIFPGYVNDAPHLLRMRTDTGAVTAWPAVRAAHMGWSALAAGEGLVCYGDDQNQVHCACISTFEALP